MRVVLLTDPPETLENVTPIHDEDYCEACGDCLDCFGDDPCYYGGMGTHVWYVYAGNVRQWRKERGR